MLSFHAGGCADITTIGWGNLEKRGHTCVILEADRSHIGGRVRTLRFEDGLYGDVGAMRVPKTHTLTRHYIELCDLQLRPFISDNPEGCYYMRGQRIRPPEVLIGLVESGMGISLVAAGAETRHKTRAMYRPLSDCVSNLEIAVAWRKGKTSLVLNQFLNTVKNDE